MNTKKHGGYKHLTVADRYVIEAGMNRGYSFKRIATTLNRASSTIAREVKNHRVFVDAVSPVLNDCIYRPTCKMSNLCEEACMGRCAYCREYDCRSQLKRVGDSITSLTTNINSVVNENKEGLSASLGTLSVVLDNFRMVLSQFDEGGSSGTDLRQTVVRIGDAAKSVKDLAGKIEEVFFDEEQDPGFAINDVKNIVGQANRIISDIEDIYLEGNVGIHGVVNGQIQGDTLADISLWIGSRSRNMGFLLGAEDIGADPGVTAALGISRSWFRIWAGAIRGYPGAGFMLSPAGEEGKFSMGAQWWDQTGGRWSIEGRYHLQDNWGIFYKYTDTGSDDLGSAGVFYRF